jgi:hypothetical protein
LGPWSLPPVDRAGSVPSDIVLAFFGNQPDALKHIGNVINTSFLYVEVLHSVIEIKRLVWSLLEQIDELFCKLDQSVFLAATPTIAIAHRPVIVEVLHFLNAESPRHRSQLHVPAVWLAAAFVVRFFLRRPHRLAIILLDILRLTTRSDLLSFLAASGKCTLYWSVIIRVVGEDIFFFYIFLLLLLASRISSH